MLETKQSARSVVAPLRPNGKAKASERTFLFTPSGKVNDRKALSIGVTTRTLNLADRDADKTAANSVDVSGYNVGLSVGYRGFSVEAGYSRLDDARLHGSEGVDLGLSYRGKDWKTTLQVAGERYGDDKSVAPLGLDKSYSVELGGAYLLTPRLSLTGGIKYQVVSPREELRARDTDQASGSVYVGTNLKF
ncbi:porin [Pedomonas mirosovicensis]|uniref:porin n=1 Tax=Pedomonas mirosovicensis TaxID=2908641 RepID=UPI0021690374|nr:porin [Pedomonas mirosovicensis]MCH8684120.1 porin [Pedomonas mirosovicensis]